MCRSCKTMRPRRPEWLSPGLRGEEEERLDRIGSCSPMWDGPSFRKGRSEGCTENVPIGRKPGVGPRVRRLLEGPGEGCTGLIVSNTVRHVPFWVYFEAKPRGFAGGLQVGTERKRGVGFWPEGLERDKLRKFRGSQTHEQFKDRKRKCGVCDILS